MTHDLIRWETLAAEYNRLCASLEGPDRGERLAKLEAEMMAVAEECKDVAADPERE